MARKTEGVYELVQDVLSTFSEPYGEDITEDVCLAIEGSPEWMPRYEALSKELRDWVVNNSIGYYTKQLTGLHAGRKAVARRSSLIQYYTKLRPS
jgi:hypothetical protein